MLKNERGITLVALVVTIIVLIILAAISITAIAGNEGIITRAEQGRDIYKEAEENWTEFRTEVEDFIGSYVS